jgi:hypothetical protein
VEAFLCLARGGGKETQYLRQILNLTGLTMLLWHAGAAVAADKPNILVIWGDDVGITNISAYSKGLVGYQMMCYSIDFIQPSKMLWSTNILFKKSIRSPNGT